MKNLKSILLCLVLFLVSVLLVGCGTANHYYTSDEIDALLQKMDELLEKESTINVEPDITITMPEDEENDWIQALQLEYLSNEITTVYSTYEASVIGEIEIDINTYDESKAIYRSVVTEHPTTFTQSINEMLVIPSGTVVHYEWAGKMYQATLEYTIHWVEIKVVTEKQCWVKHDGITELITTDYYKATQI